MAINKSYLRKSHLPSYIRGGKTVITTEVIENALAEFWGGGTTKEAIAKKYNVCPTTIYRWAAKNKHLREKFLKEPPEPVIFRSKLTEMERLRLINDDAMSIVELTLEVVKGRLEDEIKAKKEGIEGTTHIKMNELSVVLAEITPYIMAKKPIPTAKKGKDSAGEGNPAGKVIKGGMFKKAQ